MLAVVLAALRSGRSATAALWLLAALVTAGAVAAPGYLLAAADRVVAWADRVVARDDRVVARDVADTPAAQKAILLTEQTAAFGNDRTAIDRTRADLHRALALPGAAEVDGLRVDAPVAAPVGAGQAIVARDGVCRHVRVTGGCPAAPDPVTFQGTAIRFDIDVTQFATSAGLDGVPSIRGNDFAATVRVTATLVPEIPTDTGVTVDGRPAVVDLGAIQTPGAHAYPAIVPACAPGCRFTALSFRTWQGIELSLDVTVADLVVTAPAAPTGPAAQTAPAAPTGPAAQTASAAASAFPGGAVDRAVRSRRDRESAGVASAFPGGAVDWAVRSRRDRESAGAAPAFPGGAVDRAVRSRPDRG